jgi:hypothetical protein
MTDPAVAALRRWAVVLDSAFRVPGTAVRFGLDPLLGLFPGLGDLTTPLFSILILVHAVRLRVPRVVQLRMLLNAAIDSGLGVVPVIGDVFDVAWKANVRNLALLERHAGPGVRPSAGDWVFVILVIGPLIVMAILPILLLTWLLELASGR